MLYKIIVIVTVLFVSGCMRYTEDKDVDNRTPEQIQDSIREEEEIMNNPTRLNFSPADLSTELNNTNKFNYSEKDGLIYFEAVSKDYTISFGKDGMGALYINIYSSEPTKDNTLMKDLSSTLKDIFDLLGEEYDEATIIEFIESGYPYTEYKSIEELYNPRIKLLAYTYVNGIELDIYPVRQK